MRCGVHVGLIDDTVGGDRNSELSFWERVDKGPGLPGVRERIVGSKGHSHALDSTRGCTGSKPLPDFFPKVFPC